MSSIWDMLPAGAWPVEPFVWPLDPMERPPGPQTVSPQPSAASASAFGWAPAAPAAASAPAFGWASAPPASPNAPAYSGATDPDAFLGAFPHPEIDPARTARLLEDARLAHEFALWAFGPPSRPARQTRELAAGPDAPADRSATPVAVAADAVDAPPRNGATSGSDDVVDRPAPADMPVRPNRADQPDVPFVNPDVTPTQAGLEAATGNPNIERQGERIRTAAAARKPPPALVRAAADRFAHGLHDAITDIPHEIYQAGADALHEMDEGLNPFSSVYRAAADRERRARMTGTPGDVLASEWETHKRHGRGVRGIAGLLGAPITGAARSVLGHALEMLPGFTYEDAKQGVDQALMGLGPGRGGLPRAPRASFEAPRPPPVAPLRAPAERMPEPARAVDRGRADPQPGIAPEPHPEGLPDNANHAQNWYDEEFKKDGPFAGQTIDQRVAGLTSGDLKLTDNPINYIVRDGHILILNTRSSQVLERAGVPRSKWHAVNKTGDLEAERDLDRQLRKNGLTREGTSRVMRRRDWLEAGNPLFPP